jgi:two-component system chemotaxis response regulator CheB
VRKLLEGIFQGQGDFDVRLARNGAEALEFVRSFDPQVVTLDVQSAPHGRADLSQADHERGAAPGGDDFRPSEEGAKATLDAIELGAVDFVAKPSGTVSLEIDRMAPLVVQKVRAAANVRISRTLGLRERIRHQFRGAGVVPTAARPLRTSPQHSKGDVSRAWS